MLQYNPTVSGSLTVTGTISATQGITGSFSGSIAGLPTDTLAFSSSLSTRITNTELTSSEYVSTSGSLSTRVTAAEATSSAFVAASGSLSTRVTNAEATASAFVTASGSLSTRTTNSENYIAAINTKTGSYATTGSNYFIGTQVITGSVYISSDLIVQGSSSLQNITASAVSIGTNTVILNTDSPAVRFAGISVRDSGSNSAVTSSIWYDSLNNKWIYQNESGSSYSGGMFISGPRNTGSLGDEAGMTSNYIAKGLGGDHIGPSIIFESGSNIGIGITTPSQPLHVYATSTTTSAFFETNAANSYIGLKSTSGINYVGNVGYAMTFEAGGAERMRITNGGNVGIGITNPSTKFQVSGDVALGGSLNSAWAVSVDNLGTTGANGLYVNIGASSTGVPFSVYKNFAALFQIANSGAATFSSSVTAAGGLITKGSSTNVNNSLKFLRADNSEMGYIGWSNESANNSTWLFKSSNGNTIGFSADGTNQNMVITSGGSVGIGNTSPSYKLDIHNGSDFDIRLRDTSLGGTVGILFESANDFSGTSQSYIKGIGAGNSGVSELIFGTAGSSGNTTATERMRITSGGNVGIGTTSPLQTSSNRIVTTINGTTSAVLNLSTGGTLRSYLYADSGGSTFETVGTNTIAANSTNMISFTTNGTERMKIMSGGAVGTGQSANGTSLRATLVKRGTTSVTFSMSLNTIGSWRPGFATIRVSGAQNGLQEAYAAWFIYRITGYFGAGTAINLLSSGGDTGSVSISSSSDQNSPQAFSITVTDSGSTTDTMIADLDVAYHEGIISLT
jgi:hypothetical protein